MGFFKRKTLNDINKEIEELKLKQHETRARARAVIELQERKRSLDRLREQANPGIMTNLRKSLTKENIGKGLHKIAKGAQKVGDYAAARQGKFDRINSLLQGNGIPKKNPAPRPKAHRPNVVYVQAPPQYITQPGPAHAPQKKKNPYGYLF